MTEEFNTLEEYASTIKICLENILHDYQMATDSQVKVLYATSSIAYAKEQEHFANGSNVGPLVTFYQSGIEVKQNEAIGMWKILPVKSDQGNYLMKAPIIAKINYTVTIDALTEVQADMLVSQILLGTPFQRPYYTKLNGQFVQISSDGVTNLSSVDIGENKDKVVRREIKLVIDRAYINYEIRELNAGTINADGTITKNPSQGNDGFFNYNVLDEDGNVIGVKQIGKVKLRAYALDGE